MYASENRLGQTVQTGQQTLGHLKLFSDYVRGPMPNWIPVSKNIHPSLVLVQPRKTCPFITERLLMGSKESNQTKQSLEVIKLNSCSTQLSRKLILLINVKMPTIVGILTIISMINTTSERLKARNFFICRYFSFYEQLKFRAQLSWAWKKVL